MLGAIIEFICTPPGRLDNDVDQPFFRALRREVSEETGPLRLAPTRFGSFRGYFRFHDGLLLGDTHTIIQKLCRNLCRCSISPPRRR